MTDRKSINFSYGYKSSKSPCKGCEKRTHKGRSPICNKLDDELAKGWPIEKITGNRN